MDSRWTESIPDVSEDVCVPDVSGSVARKGVMHGAVPPVARGALLGSPIVLSHRRLR